MLSLTIFYSFFCMWTSRKLFHLSFRRASLPTIHLIWWFPNSIDLKLSNKRQKIFDSFFSIPLEINFPVIVLFKHTYILVHGFNERKKAKVLVPQSCLTVCDLTVYIACQVRLSIGLSRQELKGVAIWRGLPFPSPGDLFKLGLKILEKSLFFIFYIHIYIHWGMNIFCHKTSCSYPHFVCVCDMLGLPVYSHFSSQQLSLIIH